MQKEKQQPLEQYPPPTLHKQQHQLRTKLFLLVYTMKKTVKEDG